MNYGKQYAELFERDIRLVIKEINEYPDELSLWKPAIGIHNSGGNLALHLAGNLRHFIGHIIGKSDYKRNRAAEFESKHVPKSHVIAELELALQEVPLTLERMTETQMHEIFPVNIIGEVTTAAFIAHLYGHLNYHRGQINYHRRMTVAA